MIRIANESKINFNGKEYELVFAGKDFLKPRVIMDGDRLHVFKSEIETTRHRAIALNYLRDRASIILTNRTRYLADRFGFRVKDITIRDQTSRWGSCSSAKNINLNWRLIFAPKEVSDYVILHELAHTVVMDHSKRFWSLVEKLNPKWKEHRNWLRDHGEKLSVR